MQEKYYLKKLSEAAIMAGISGFFGSNVKTANVCAFAGMIVKAIDDSVRKDHKALTADFFGFVATALGANILRHFFGLPISYCYLLAGLILAAQSYLKSQVLDQPINYENR